MSTEEDAVGELARHLDTALRLEEIQKEYQSCLGPLLEYPGELKDAWEHWRIRSLNPGAPSHTLTTTLCVKLVRLIVAAHREELSLESPPLELADLAVLCQAASRYRAFRDAGTC